MTEYRWAHLRETAISNWGTAPQGQLEADIITIFENHPALVATTITKIGDSFTAGKINNPWAVLRTDLQRATTPERTPVATDKRDRDQAIAAAEQWVRATGIHYPTETEVLNHLFGVQEHTAPLEYLEQVERETRDRPGRYLYDALLHASIDRTRREGVQQVPPTPDDGLLATHRSAELEARIIALWHQHRPTGQKLEQQAAERGERYQQNLADQEHRRKQKLHDLDAKQREPETVA